MTNAIIRILINYALQMAFTLGAVFVFGKVIAVCNGMFYKNLGSRATWVCYATGFIGTPIHESAHALMCLLFGHKITEIKFFQMNSSDGTLGYVNHSYNPKNLYQRIGNLFIGVAPVLVGAGVLCGLLYLLMPELFFNTLNNVSDSGDDVVKALKSVLTSVKNMFGFVTQWQWWVFIFVGSFIALHMTLSDADLKGAVSGVFLYAAVVLVIDIVLGIVSPSLLVKVTKGIMVFGNFMLFFFCIFILISLILLLISFAVRKFLR